MKDEKISPTGRVLYLRGLAEGMEIDKASKEGKLLLSILDVLGDFAMELEHLSASHEDMREAVEGLDDALEGVEAWIFDDEDDESDSEGSSCVIEPVDEGSFIEYECPHCANKIYYDANAFNLHENHLCPECGKNLFPVDDATESGKK